MILYQCTVFFRDGSEKLPRTTYISSSNVFSCSNVLLARLLICNTIKDEAEIIKMEIKAVAEY